MDVEERRARLAERHRLLAATRTDDVPAIADDLVALHSSDPVTVYLSALTRMAHPSIEAVEDAIYEQRSVIRHHGMRSTLWVATPPVVRLIHAAATRGLVEPARRRTAGMLRDSGIAEPEAWLAKAEQKVLGDLRLHGPSTAREVGQRIGSLTHKLTLAPGKRYTASQSAHTRVLTILGLAGKMLRTRPDGGWSSGTYRYATAESWLTGGLGELDARESAADLADRWLRRFGPATTADLRWWAGWTVAVTKRALTDCRAVAVELESGPGWVTVDDGPVGEPEPWVAVLPSLDSTVMGWKERDWYLPDRAAEAFDRNGNAGPTIWVDGRVVGAWAHRPDGSIATHYFERVAARRRREADEQLARLRSAVGGTRFTVRFPGLINEALLR